MIGDYEQYLTKVDGVGAGENLRPAASAYGQRPFISKGFFDVGVGQKVTAFYRVKENYNTLTSAVISIVGCDDTTEPGLTTAGTNEVTLAATGTVLLAALVTTNNIVRIGVLNAGSRKKMLRAKFTTTGTQPTAGAITVFFVEGDTSVPNNDGTVI